MVYRTNRQTVSAAVQYFKTAKRRKRRASSRRTTILYTYDCHSAVRILYCTYVYYVSVQYVQYGILLPPAVLLLYSVLYVPGGLLRE